MTLACMHLPTYILKKVALRLGVDNDVLEVPGSPSGHEGEMRPHENVRNRPNSIPWMAWFVVFAACAGVCALCGLVAGIFVWQIIAPSGNVKTLDDGEIFAKVAGVSSEKFGDIKCFYDTSIDETFHCRFTFSDFGDLEEIIVANNLSRRDSRRQFFFGIAGAKYPEWYDLQSIPSDSRVYHKYGGDTRENSMSLYIDLQSNVAYLETMD